MPIIYAMNCDDWYHSAQVKHCIFGRAEAKKTAVLLGDSIGAQWFSVLTETLDPAQWKIVVYTKSSCPIVDETIYYDRIKRDYTECTQWRNLVIQDIQHITPDLLMIGSAGSYNLNETQWQDGTRRIIQKLVPSVKSIYLIESNPPLDIDGPSCLEQRRENHSLSHECKTPAVNQKYAAAAVSLIEVAKTEPKTKWIAPADIVCPNKECHAERDNKVIYRDNQHLTDSFVKSVSNRIAAQMQDDINQP